MEIKKCTDRAFFVPERYADPVIYLEVGGNTTNF